MDHEFWFEGRKPVARTEDDLSAFGLWLTDEISDDLKHLRALITTTELLLEGGLRDYRWQGKAMVLQLNRQDAEVNAHDLYFDEDLNLEDENLSLQDFDQQAVCGLEDFHELLLAWKNFITG